MDYGGDAFYTELAARAIDGWHAANERWGEAVYRECGILILTRGAWERESFERRSFELLRSRGEPLERIGAGELARRFPGFRGSPYRDGYFNPRGGWVSSARAVTLLAREARDAGVELVTARIAGIARPPPELVLDGGGRLRADALVVAAGAWTPWLVPAVRDFLRPNGQAVVHFAPADPGPFEDTRFPVWCGDIARTGWYGFPVGPTGAVKVGHHGPGRPVAPGDPLAVTDEERERAERFVATSFPALAGARVTATRLCLYCDTPDGDFLVAELPDAPGTFVAAGGSGHGFKFAPVLGAVIADVVLGRSNPVADRFRWRSPHEETTEEARHTAT
jgi:glycine/D-amino acid oxidase-like deaminating enzyme